ncbi:hypothetical protein NDU88_007255 [Pleurodeles waltl]|uniref:Uncharacterized protein n=1 Tax=Pleurodeles waltl TaxID=8319 RepID=A0AAV7USD5_PLEWA|nr:hypothetical protein NDU88_007255 [Pleurodeles waltl]
MVLGREATLEHSKEELKEIAELEKELLDCDSLEEVKKALAKLIKTIQEFNANEVKKKADKVPKYFSKEKVHPYLLADYCAQTQPSSKT